MLHLKFSKYQGAGNDFIIIDNRNRAIELSTKQIEFLCHRRFGIGADGLMLIENADDNNDFRMVYYNADGHISTMCGNGGRCIILAAHDLGIITDHTQFIAIDGEHTGEIIREAVVRLGMIDVDTIDSYQGYQVLNTGSPHIVIPVENIDEIDVYQEGKRMRQDPHFGEKGINVNFIKFEKDHIRIRTYERGVEDETWACGTGVTAAAISSVEKKPGVYSIPLKAQGGDLLVDFRITEDLKIRDIYLTGGAVKVYDGEIQL